MHTNTQFCNKQTHTRTHAHDNTITHTYTRTQEMVQSYKLVVLGEGGVGKSGEKVKGCMK